MRRHLRSLAVRQCPLTRSASCRRLHSPTVLVHRIRLSKLPSQSTPCLFPAPDRHASQSEHHLAFRSRPARVTKRASPCPLLHASQSKRLRFFLVRHGSQSERFPSSTICPAHSCTPSSSHGCNPHLSVASSCLTGGPCASTPLASRPRPQVAEKPPRRRRQAAPPRSGRWTRRASPLASGRGVLAPIPKVPRPQSRRRPRRPRPPHHSRHSSHSRPPRPRRPPHQPHPPHPPRPPRHRPGVARAPRSRASPGGAPNSG